MSENLNATLIVELTMENIIDQDSLDNFFGDNAPATLQEAVKIIIESEGLWGVVDDGYKILSIKHLTPVVADSGEAVQNENDVSNSHRR